MEMALGRQRVLVLRVLSQPARSAYDGARSEDLYRRRELRRQLEHERMAHDRMATGAMGWWKGLY